MAKRKSSDNDTKSTKEEAEEGVARNEHTTKPAKKRVFHRVVTARAKHARVKNAVNDKNKLISIMLQFHVQGMKNVTFGHVSDLLKVTERNNRWLTVWELVQQQELISGNDDQGYEISPKGLHHVTTLEYKEYLQDMNFVATSNQEYQAHLKESFEKNHSERIFDLLLKHGALTRKDLAALVGKNDKGHPFSYSLQELNHLGLTEQITITETSGKVRKKCQLSNKAFLAAVDRPEPVPVDPEEMKRAVEAVYGNSKPRPAKKRKAKVKEEESKEDPNEQEERALAAAAASVGAPVPVTAAAISLAGLAALETVPLPKAALKIENVETNPNNDTVSEEEVVPSTASATVIRPSDKESLGIHICSKNGHICIDTIESDSPLINTPLQPGFEIVSINGKNAADLNVGTASALLRATVGTLTIVARNSNTQEKDDEASSEKTPADSAIALGTAEAKNDEDEAESAKKAGKTIEEEEEGKDKVNNKEKKLIEV